MKLHQYNHNSTHCANAFTLIEMIGVLAVIAILAALLIPKVTNAIDDSRINNTLGSYEAAKLAVTDHYAKYNGFNLTTNGAVLASQDLLNFGNILMLEGLMDKPFSSKIGTNAALVVTPGNSTGYLLDGTNNLTTNMTYVVSAAIAGVLPQDAYAISTRLDGGHVPTLSPTVTTSGRCSYTNDGVNNILLMYLTGH